MNYRNMMDFSEKSVLITGGTGSMGREFACAFASCGANIIIDVYKRQGNEHASGPHSRRHTCEVIFLGFFVHKAK